MFCRIDVLTREAKARRVVLTRYTTAASFEEAKGFAEHQRRAYGAEGFRIYDLHTGKAQEIWDLG